MLKQELLEDLKKIITEEYGVTLPNEAVLSLGLGMMSYIEALIALSSKSNQESNAKESHDRERSEK